MTMLLIIDQKSVVTHTSWLWKFFAAYSSVICKYSATANFYWIVLGFFFRMLQSKDGKTVN